MANNIGKKDLSWAYVSQILYSGLNIFILPVVINKLSSAELGLWYTFTAIGAFVTMLDFGFLSTILRNLTYAWTGSKELQKEGVVETGTLNEHNFDLFAIVLKATQIIYLGISVIALIIMMTAGTIYIRSIALTELSQSQFFLAWIIYAFSVAFNIFYSYWTPVLRSVGGIKQSYQILVVSKVVQLIVSIGGLLMGYGLLAISLAYLIAQASTRIMSRIAFVRIHDVKENYRIIIKSEFDFARVKDILVVLWPNAYKQGVIAVAKFLSSKASVLICSSFLGLTMSSQLGLSGQLFGIFITISNVMAISYSPTIASLYVSGDMDKLYNTFTRVYGFQLVFLFFSGVFLILFGDEVLHLFRSNTYLLTTVPLAFFLLTCCVNNSFEIVCNYIALGNKIPMYRARIISSILTVLFQYLLVKFVPSLGIWGILVPSFVVISAYNGWRWVKYVADEHGKSFFQIHIDSLYGLKQFLGSCLKNKSYDKE
jgi:O-antigen/teichoic acid export membrane protein